MLREYDALVKGSAERLLNAHSAKEEAATQAVTRMTRAESIAVTAGSLGTVVVAFAGILLGIVLIAVRGDAIGVIAMIPGIISALANLAAAIRGDHDRAKK